MNLNRGFIRIAAVLVGLACAISAVRFVGQASENSPAIKVDSAPLNRDPQSGNSYAPVIKKVVPSVVNIYSTRFVKQRLYRNPLMADPVIRQLFGDQEADDSQLRLRRDEWLGCGIIVAPDGYILTANHVVDGADEIKVTVQNDKTYSAKVVGLDVPTDVAVLKIEAKDLPAVTLGDSDQLQVGDVVLAIGNPFGIGQTVTRGIVSALGRSDPSALRMYQSFIQTDAAINEGNSGGALVDAVGRLVGINDAIVSPSGTSAGIGFAVPINLARSVMDGFIKSGRVSRGYLGVRLQDINAVLAKFYAVPTSDGVLVTDIPADSPAAKAGLLPDDVIVAINGKGISSEDNLKVTVSQLAPGSEARVKIYRNGTPKTISVTLGERSDMAPQDPAKPDNSKPVQPARADALDGVVVQDLTPRIRRQLGAEPGAVGGLVIDVDHASNAYEAGLRPGDVILEVNRKAVADAEETRRVCKATTTDDIIVKIWRPERGGSRIRVLDVDNTRRTN